MPETTLQTRSFQFRGWHVLVAIALLLGIAGAKVAMRIRPIDDDMREAMRVALLKEYSGRGRADVARLVAEARAGSPLEPIQPLVQRNVEFTSVGAHGAILGAETLVLAEITVDGGPPPDGRAVRYFRMKPKLDGGWMVVGETSAYFYYTELTR
jgi:hypothetical protein